MMTEYKLSEIVNKKMTEWIDKKQNEYYYGAISNYFTHRALPWLFQQKLDKKAKENILTQFDANKLILVDNNYLIDMICSALKDKDNYHQFGGLRVCKNLTLKQLDKLKSSWGLQIGDTLPFLGTYIKKLAPLTMQKYEHKQWDDIPLKVRDSYLTKLYQYAIDKVSAMNSGQYTCRAYICWHYIIFKEKHYGQYEIDAIMEYLSIPKYSNYMRRDEGGFFKALKSVVTGEPQANIGASFDFLNCYKGVPAWNNFEDEHFMKRFLLRLFSDNTIWPKFYDLDHQRSDRRKRAITERKRKKPFGCQL